MQQKNNPLRIVSESDSTPKPPPSLASLSSLKKTPPLPQTATNLSSNANKKNITQAIYNRKWLNNPNKYSFNKNCIEKERFTRTLNFIKEKSELPNKQIIDLGAGSGELGIALQSLGAQVHITDAASNAIKEIKKNIESRYYSNQLSTAENSPKNTLPTTAIEVLPLTRLKDNFYDYVIATDILEELHSNEFRLFFSELARIIKPSGKIFCSTKLDIYSSNALTKFLALTSTEFEIQEIVLSHHSWHIKISNFFKIPQLLHKTSTDPFLKKQLLKNKKRFAYFFWDLASKKPFKYLWKILSIAVRPMNHFLMNNRKFLIILEWLCSRLNFDNGVSHIIIEGKRKKMF